MAAFRALEQAYQVIVLALGYSDIGGEAGRGVELVTGSELRVYIVRFDSQDM